MLKFMSRVRDVGGRDWEMVLLERACEAEVVSTGERCLRHQERGVNERIEVELKERRGPGTVNALRAHGRKLLL